MFDNLRKAEELSELHMTRKNSSVDFWLSPSITYQQHILKLWS